MKAQAQKLSNLLKITKQIGNGKFLIQSQISKALFH
jgi:hypothetical protein